ncbi:carbohydrate ABC transporter permease [Saccharothrix obliqua]|uniref:carbohydrate ABC transporter permease n=1 Tax=Saccharothrix obliqua TaxID=2861747 RepID=UPI001C605D86|nr:carbohydrate ABC transporter permease [Saccharothrix obliqua]MBW4721382.1 carbohydrate ABC transporter permease [Saccharothrix obliqua]
MRRTLFRTAGGVLMVLIAAVFVMPLLVMLRIALTAPADYREMPIDWFSAPYWESLLGVLRSDFPGKLLNSLGVSVVVTVIVVVLSALAGHALARLRSRSRERFLFFVLSTRMGPAVVFALPIYLLAANVKLIDTHVGIVLVYTFYSLAFGIWMMHGFFLDIPAEVEEAGQLDGLGNWGVFTRISLGMVRPGLIATAILVFIFTWNEFFYAFILTRSSAATFPTAIPGYFGAFQVDWGSMFSASALGVLPPMVFGLIVRKWLTTGLSGGAVR